MTSKRTLGLFEGFGVELEYMIVAADSLAVRPITDRVLHAVAGAYEAEVELGEISWSNELALHVIELKTSGPASSLVELPALFQQHVARINELLSPLDARLMPTAMHPWMDPHREVKLWPHEYNAVYEAFNRIFDCRGHGWGNLQSVHLNLPFRDDEQFGQLHAAIRLLLPILPALAASSPLIDGRLSGQHDTRLEVYRTNARKIPSVTGQVIPEPAYTRAEYDRQIFQPLYADIAPHDPDGTLQFEWLNARGAIARFDRNAIEIRVLDIQECPRADIAICAAIAAVLRALVAEQWSGLAGQQALPTQPLVNILNDCIRDAQSAAITEASYLSLFGCDGVESLTAGELWQRLLDESLFADSDGELWRAPLEVILAKGTLAARIIRELKSDVSPERLSAVYRELCDCLSGDRMFHAGG